ncbi:hypothetical protein DEU56DRAFT_914893 [Suillus clintonianus]|uniref:uncharacterized protein n=1 Tax=Suillus clintonianus TaxID=1904413 RepID=UPI001B85C869|nr:uncharacterized protein DEU56DRAFT_914893 [Suillus clintonianus]KAG2130265.1 hypothetical protein DEU56DRAFT_914893 [Suillus clintonianus]
MRLHARLESSLHSWDSFLLSCQSKLRWVGSKPIELKYYRFYGKSRPLQEQVQGITRIGRFVHHQFPDPAETKPVTGRRGRGGFFNEPDSPEMDSTAVTGSGHRDIDQSGMLAESPNLPPHPTTTSSSDNATHTHHNSAEQQESEGVTVHDEDMYTMGRISPLNLDIDHEAAMMKGNSRSGTTFVMANGMEVVPDEIDDDWYHASQAVTAAVAAASQLQFAAESNSDSESVLMATAAMDSYIDWPEEDSE